MPDIFQQVREARENGDSDTVVKLLVRFIRRREQRVAEGKEYKVDGWAYEQLAKTYRKQLEFTKEIELLLRFIQNEEQGVRDCKQTGVPAWPYDRLAAIYRRKKEYSKVVEIIKRFIGQPKSAGRQEETLPGRLAKAEELAGNNSNVVRATRGSIAKSNQVSRFVAFDIEIAKILPKYTEDLKAFRPLGICCAAVLESIEDHPHLWYSCDDDGKHAPQMAKHDLQELVRFLCNLVANGASLVTWNGLGFDFDILAEESGLYDECKELAVNHLDLMFHVFCEQGYPVSLNAACGALGLKGKPNHFTNADVPRLWKEAKCDEVLDYVANDCRMVLDVFQTCTQRRSFEWITQKGKHRAFSLPHGWLKVCYAVNIPLPDTSWMSKPISRTKFLDWTGYSAPPRRAEV